jgi:hypothetical protein
MRVAKTCAAAMVAAFGIADGAVAGSAGRCGGTGGEHTKTLTCPTGEYIAALGARGGLLIDEFSIACRKHPVSGQPGEIGGFKSAGPGGGTLSKSGKCGNGHAMNSISFKSGSFIDRVSSGGCNPREGSGWAGGTIPSSASVNVGGPGGIACSIICPIGEALYKVTVRYGGVVDSIRGECRK